MHSNCPLFTLSICYDQAVKTTISCIPYNTASEELDHVKPSSLITSSLEEGQQVDILVIDFAKAFDKVYHSLLIHKLHHYGIRGKINSWINGSAVAQW